jgi:tryptophan-rich sensory protein
MLEALKGAVEDAFNSRGRTVGHVFAGVALVGAAVALSAALGHYADDELQEERGTLDDPDDAPVSAVWTPLFLALTASGLRIWNAPSSRERTAGLTLWGAIQAVNALWLVLGPRRLGGNTAVTLGATAAAFAYLRAVEKLDHRAAAWVAPFVGWRSFANILLGTALEKKKAVDPDKESRTIGSHRRR